MESDSVDSPFLQIPTELRLLIYGFALADAPIITIGAAELVGSGPDIIHRLYADSRNPLPGLPQYHEPVIEASYKPSLLSITNPAIIPLTPATSCPPEDSPVAAAHTTHAILLSVCKQVREELERHFSPKNGETNTGSKLFASFPTGLHVLRTLAPGVVRHASSIHLAGTYVPSNFSTYRAARLGPSFRAWSIIETKSPTAPQEPCPSTTHLTNLLTSLFGPQPTNSTLNILELRIYYPGSDSYSAVWGDDDSPIVVALRNIYSGEVNIEVWRGWKGTGVYMRVKRNELGEGGRGERVVSTVWRKLEEGRRGEPDVGSWVVDPRWPEVDMEDRGKGEVDVVIAEG